MVGAYGSRGAHVVGFDLEPKLVEAISRAEAAFEEPQLAERLRDARERIRGARDVKDTVDNSDISFIIVPTPSAEDGSFSTRFVEAACRDIGQALRTKNAFHSVVVVSTMLPEDSRTRIIPILAEASGKIPGQGFGYAYSPSFIALGDIVRNILRPDMHLVGELDTRTGDALEAFYRAMHENDAPVERMSVESAEITKIALNSYVTMKITFANMLADLCHSVPNAHVDEVTGALGKDRRIGSAYLTGGISYGGPCFPRDNRAFQSALERYGVNQSFSDAVHDYNERMPEILLRKMQPHLPERGTVGVLGLSYKPGTPYLDESPGLKVASVLSDAGHDVLGFDPPPRLANAKLPAGIRSVSTVEEWLADADAVFIAYPAPEVSGLAALVQERARPLIVIDPWRYYPELAGARNVIYIPLGIGPALS